MHKYYNHVITIDHQDLILLTITLILSLIYMYYKNKNDKSEYKKIAESFKEFNETQKENKNNLRTEVVKLGALLNTANLEFKKNIKSFKTINEKTEIKLNKILKNQENTLKKIKSVQEEDELIKTIKKETKFTLLTSKTIEELDNTLEKMENLTKTYDEKYANIEKFKPESGYVNASKHIEQETQDLKNLIYAEYVNYQLLLQYSEKKKNLILDYVKEWQKNEGEILKNIRDGVSNVVEKSDSSDQKNYNEKNYSNSNSSKENYDDEANIYKFLIQHRGESESENSYFIEDETNNKRKSTFTHNSKLDEIT